IWSVVVDSGLYVRAYNGTNGRWYRSALEQGVGKITAAGQEYEVEFTPITDPELNDNIDAGYEAKYAGSPYLPPMIADKTRAATVLVTLRWIRLGLFPAIFRVKRPLARCPASRCRGLVRSTAAFPSPMACWVRH